MCSGPKVHCAQHLLSHPKRSFGPRHLFSDARIAPEEADCWTAKATPHGQLPGLQFLVAELRKQHDGPSAESPI